ncbi:MAG: META domain-containing protein [Candidatus Competibacteraceae bacterium]|nr:MAG: META domain-containing protein [Candidatus Competibacteraceae bacterium]
MLRTFAMGVLIVGSFSILAGCGAADSVDSAAPEREATPPPAIQGEPTDLERIAPPAFETTLRCGAQEITVGHTEAEGLRLTVGDETFDLRPVEAASGAKYAAVNDPSTTFWSKGDRALLEVRGQAYPECTTVADTAPVFRATGNEPGWLLEIGDQDLTLLKNYGETRLVAPTPVPTTTNGVNQYAVDVDGQNLTVTITARLCVDTMSGMPHPHTVTVSLDDENLEGCGGDPATLLHGAEWVVGDLNRGALIEPSRVTLNFAADGRVFGHASCNNYTGDYVLTGESLTIPQTVTTRMACEPELMAQESRFLELLENIQRFEIGADGALILHTDDLRTITARRS